MMIFIYKLFIIIVKEVKEVVVHIDIKKKISICTQHMTQYSKSARKYNFLPQRLNPTFLSNRAVPKKNAEGRNFFSKNIDFSL